MQIEQVQCARVVRSQKAGKSWNWLKSIRWSLGERLKIRQKILGWWYEEGTWKFLPLNYSYLAHLFLSKSISAVGPFPTLMQRGRLFLFWTISYFYLFTLSQNTFCVFSNEFEEFVKTILFKTVLYVLIRHGIRWIQWFCRFRGSKRLWFGCC